jgi:hypothetical protein
MTTGSDHSARVDAPEDRARPRQEEFRDTPGSPSVRLRVELHTRSGSVYIVVQDTGGAWWLGADNRPTQESRSLSDGGPWRIEAPEVWPPVVGQPAAIYALREIPYGHPARVPGGGKITSPVLRVNWVAGSDDLSPLAASA